MKIVITGSLGHISKPLAKALIAEGHSVTVISSTADRQPEIETMGGIAAIGSLQDPTFLTAAFNGADAVYCMIPPNFSAPDQILYYKSIGENYAHAIQQARIKRVVHLSSWGAHREKGTGIILGSHHVEEILNKVPDIALTHLRAGSFFYNLLNFVGMIKSAGFIGTNYGGDDTIVWVHPTDIATAASAELQKVAAAGSNVRYVASDERTANETAAVLGASIGKPDLAWRVLSNEQVKETMLQMGMSENIVTNIVDLNASIHSGVMGEDYFLHKPSEMGKVKVEDFAKEFAAVYNNR